MRRSTYAFKLALPLDVVMSIAQQQQFSREFSGLFHVYQKNGNINSTFNFIRV
jgi:hypothetical protein